MPVIIQNPKIAAPVPPPPYNQKIDPTIIVPKIIREDFKPKPSLQEYATTAEQIRMIAARATVYFQTDDRDLQSISFDGNTGEIMTPVNGVSGYDELIERMGANPAMTVKLDVSDSREGQTSSSTFTPCSIETVRALRQAYIDLYGMTDKPDYYNPPTAGDPYPDGFDYTEPAEAPIS